MIQRGEYAARLTKMMAGSIFGHFVTLLGIVLLSRLYTPMEFGEFGVFMSMVSVFVVLGAFRLELALIQVQDDLEASHLFKICLVTLLFVFVSLSLLTLLAGDVVVGLVGAETMADYMVLFPWVVCALSASQVFHQWFVRQNKVELASLSQAIRPLLVLLFQLLLFVSAVATNNGLLVGAFIGHCAVSLGSLYFSGLRLGSELDLSIRSSWELLKKYRGFVLLGAPQAMLNSVAQNLPFFLLGYYFGPVQVAIFLMAQRFLRIPSLLSSSAIMPIFYKHIAQTQISGGSISLSYYRLSFALLIGGLIPFCILAAWGESVFLFILGGEWHGIGPVVLWVSLWMFCSFIRTPSTVVLTLYRRFYFQLVYELVFILVVVLAFLVRTEFIAVIAQASISVALLNLLYIGYAAYIMRHGNLTKSEL